MDIFLAKKCHTQVIFDIISDAFDDSFCIDEVSKTLDNDKYLYFLSDDNSGVLGVNFIFDEADIITIAVLKEKQGEKIAQKLMQHMIDELKKRGITRIHLEVRQSNKKAIHLYEKFGFCDVFTRKNYYKNPLEDAKIYILEV